MKFLKFDGTDERLAITALCLDTQVLSQVAPELPADPFPSKWSNIAASWAIEHYREYKEAPGVQGVTARYTQWAATADETIAELMHKWLTGLEPSTLTTGYAVELIQKIVQKTSVSRLKDNLINSIERGATEAAVAAVEAWKRPVLGSQVDEGVFPLEDDTCIRSAFAEVTQTPLITLPGALGELMNPNMIPDALVALLAPNKSGKSAWLLHLAWRAVNQGRRTVFFSLGDMTQGQVIRRLLPKVCKRPLHPGTYRIPTSLTYKDKEPTLEYDVRQVGDEITEDMAVQAFQRFRGEDGNRFRLVTRPAGSYGAMDLDAQIDRWAQKGWMADVIVLDYVDIMLHSHSTKEVRHALNDTWTRLRGISSKYKCLVVCATQSDTGGFSKWLLGKENFNETRRILDHVTCMVGLNTTEAERKLNICRVNPIAIREAEYLSDYTGSCVASAGCYRIGAPNIISTWV